MVLGHFEEARVLIAEMGMADARSVYRQDAIQSILGSALIHLGRTSEARDRAEKGLSLARRLGDPYGLGFALVVQGWVALVAGGQARAVELFRESAAICEQHAIKDVYTWARASQGFATHRLGQPTAAQEMLTAALQIAVEIKSFVGMIFAVTFSLPLIADLGGVALAIELNAALSQFPMVANSCFFSALIQQPIETLSTEMTAAIVTAAKARGESRDLEAIVGLVLETLSKGKL